MARLVTIVCSYLGHFRTNLGINMMVWLLVELNGTWGLLAQEVWYDILLELEGRTWDLLLLKVLGLARYGMPWLRS